MERSPSSTMLQEATGRDAVATVIFPSRFFPAAGLACGMGSIGASVASNLYHGHDIGGISWPYISDTAKDMPQAGLFSYGMSVTSVMVTTIIVLNYGYVKRELYRLHGQLSTVGVKRNKAALAAGLVAAPNLGLLATFDTARAPQLHLAFVLAFFPCMVVYLLAVTSVYALLVRSADGKKSDDARFSSRRISLRASLAWKRAICGTFLVFVTLYLPLGMTLVTDWYDYANDATVHTFRAACQHVCVVCLLGFFGTFWFDFGELNFFIVQA